MVRHLTLSLLAVGVLAAFALPASAQITNGGFETGDFTGWTTASHSDGYQSYGTTHQYSTIATGFSTGTSVTHSNEVLSSLGSDIFPTEGSLFASLSNFTGLTATKITQDFVVPTAAGKLSFDTRFLSGEDISSLWDFGGVALLNGSTVVAQYNLDNSGDADLHASSTAAGGFPDSTPWTSHSFSLTGLGGDTLTLVAYVSNVTDTAVESRLLLDNVHFSGAATTPEPGTFALLIAGGLSGGGLLLRRRARK